jgi:hypothetical protein
MIIRIAMMLTALLLLTLPEIGRSSHLLNDRVNEVTVYSKLPLTVPGERGSVRREWEPGVLLLQLPELPHLRGQQPPNFFFQR